MNQIPPAKPHFPSIALDSTLGTGLQKERKKIGIVTADLLGPIKNGGVGTAYASLAELLASAGHEVTIIFANNFSDDESSFHVWQKHYKQKNVTLLSLREPVAILDNLMPTRRSHAVYEMLKDFDFDIVHFPDLYGLGYFSQLAKRQGIAFQNTLFCVILNGPQAWSFSSNAQLPHDLNAIQLFYFERKSVEWADVLVSPSQYGLTWALEQGWKLPRNTFVEQYVMPASARRQYQGRRGSFSEIVFFGRLETRKGLELFCSAIERLPHSRLKKTKITFLGRYGVVTGQPAESYLKKRLAKWRLEYEIIPDLNQEEAIDYLLNTHPLVVIPSKSETLGFTVMECIETGLPFIASRIPAFRELIIDSDQSAVFFEETPAALTQKILELFDGKATPVRLKASKETTDANWLNWHKNVPLWRETTKPAQARPLVSVCIVHKNRPEFLKAAINSILAQTYKNIEIVLIDDASDLPKAKRLLGELQSNFADKGWPLTIMDSSVGPGYCRNKAVKLARGEYVMLMDDDNLAMPKEVDVLISVALKTNAAIVTCGFERFKGVKPEKYSAQQKIRYIGIGDDLNQAVYINVFGDTNALYRRDVYLQLGGQATERGLAFEDYDLFLRAVLKGHRLEACPEILFWYREHDSQYTSETDPFKTLEFRMRNFTDFYGQDFRPFLGLIHAVNYQQNFVRPAVQNRQPLMNSVRSNLFSGNSEKINFIWGNDPSQVKAQGVKLLWNGRQATAKFLNEQSVLSFSLDQAKAGNSAQHFLDLTISALEPTVLKLDYKKKNENQSTQVIKPVRVGKNHLRFRLLKNDMMAPLELRLGAKTSTVYISEFSLYGIGENADSNRT